MAVSHEDRLVSAVDWSGYRLAPVARSGADALVGMLVVNPVGAQRSTNPANVAAFSNRGLEWAVPLDRSRLTVTKDVARNAEQVFRGFWNGIAARSNSATGGAIWQPGHPVGDRGVEIGASGTRPTGHPWLTLLVLPNGLHLVCPISARVGERERGYQAWFDALELVDLAGQPLAAKVGVLNPGDGAVEVNHFALLRPVDEGWDELAKLGAGAAPSRGLDHVIDKLVRQWPQMANGEVLYACSAAVPLAAQCDECAGR